MVHRAVRFERRRGLPGGKYTCRRCGKISVELKNEDSIRVKCADCGGTCDPENGLQPECSAHPSTDWGK